MLIDQALEIAGNDFALMEGFDFKAIDIVRDFDPRVDRVPCIGNELEQVLLNPEERGPGHPCAPQR